MRADAYETRVWALDGDGRQSWGLVPDGARAPRRGPGRTTVATGHMRSMAQPGRARALGARGRRFESSCSDCESSVLLDHQQTRNPTPKRHSNVLSVGQATSGPPGPAPASRCNSGHAPLRRKGTTLPRRPVRQRRGLSPVQSKW